ncbi:hypothetical protein AM592_01980 [Bacillus gobiensis]|uniref:Uncharacterized protein n=1 Tax=Bacillus gobiensis TaxID=1441095 RepID=A0A0M4FV47_9BACI|nr:hypothetical protein AM592_01980 [Bacillus gobiensis]
MTNFLGQVLTQACPFISTILFYAATLDKPRLIIEIQAPPTIFLEILFDFQIVLFSNMSFHLIQDSFVRKTYKLLTYLIV